MHDDYKNKKYGYHNQHDPQLTYNQPINTISIEQSPVIKFGCGMHTLYSKEFWNLIDIPESFGGYGSEDAFAMLASDIAIQHNIPIEQYILKGIYITENLFNREPSFNEKIKNIFSKENSKDKSWKLMNNELLKFRNKITL